MSVPLRCQDGIPSSSWGPEWENKSRGTLLVATSNWLVRLPRHELETAIFFQGAPDVKTGSPADGKMMRALLLLAIFTRCICAGKNDVVAKLATVFTHKPVQYFYFRNSDVVMLHESKSNHVWRSADQGVSWEKLSKLSDQKKTVIEHPHDNQRAHVLLQITKQMYSTNDRGKTWQERQLPIEPASLDKKTLLFHSGKPEYLIFMGQQCLTPSPCHQVAYYSLNDGQEWKLMRAHVQQCHWAFANKQFKSQTAELGVFCTEWQDKTQQLADDLVMAFSDDFFTASVNKITYDKQQVSGVIGFGVVNRFMVVAIKPIGSSDLDLYVTTNGQKFYNSQFPVGTVIKQQEAYTVLESSATSLLVDVFTNHGFNNEHGTLYRSDSDGRYFVQSLLNVNRNSGGTVDYERIQGVDGIALANIVSNPDELSTQFTEAKRIESRITFDNGASWRFLRQPTKDLDGKPFACGTEANEKCALHLHSVTSPHTPGYMFSDAAVPGVVAGVGNVGDYLSQYTDCDTFLSVDGGLNWQMVKRGPYRVETADQGGIIALVSDKDATSTVTYSLDFGKTWLDYNFGAQLRAQIITSDPESTSQKMLVFGSSVTDSDQFRVQSLDFIRVQDRKCGTDDFEWWHARSLNEDAECLLGHKQMIQRRKQAASCYVGRNYDKPEVRTSNCQCTAENFECNFGYVVDAKNADNCVEGQKMGVPVGSCMGDATEYEAPPRYRKIPGDTCIGSFLDREDKIKTPRTSVDRSANIVSHPKELPNNIIKKIYFEGSSSVMLHDNAGLVWLSQNDGASFELMTISGKGDLGKAYTVTHLFMNDVVKERVYAFTSDEKLYWSENLGQSFTEINLPAKPNRLDCTLLDFHPTERDWMVYISSDECPNCHTSAYVSTDNGHTWGDAIDTFVDKCVFSQDKNFNQVEKDAIFCSAYENKYNDQSKFDKAPFIYGNTLSLYKYAQFGKGGKGGEKLAERVVQFYVYERFLAVAVEQDSDVKLLISADGKSFNEAQFPPHMSMSRKAFTIVQSRPGTLFLDVQQKTKLDQEYGFLFSSNANGTQYRQTMSYTNRNSRGFVDFEQIQVDGILITNHVTNADALSQGVGKKIKTSISFDEGAHWNNILSATDLKGAKLPCSDDKIGCSLNLHGRSEITWSGPIFSAESAPGIMMGLGNYGPQLLSYAMSNTYLSRDGGHNWMQVLTGPHIFEFGDSGGLVVAVPDGEATNSLKYSINNGQDWNAYTFNEKPVRVTSLLIEPSGKGDKFLVFGVATSSIRKRSIVGSVGSFLRSLVGLGDSSSNGVDQNVVIQVDFQHAAPRTCTFKDDESGDFQKWFPNDKECILGQEIFYWRRKQESVCHVGNTKPDDAVVIRQCPCTPADYECDTGFWPDKNGKCQLDGEDVQEPVGCAKSSKYKGRSGYRKIAATKCIGAVAELEERIDRECQGTNTGGVVFVPPGPGRAGVLSQLFERPVASILWFDKSENALMRDLNDSIWQSKNAGKLWSKTVISDRISVVTQNPYFKDRVYLMSSTSSYLYASIDQGQTYNLLEMPAPPNTLKAPLLEFHAEEPDWIIFVGQKECPGQNCHTVAFYTMNNGLLWTEFNTYVQDCEWGRDALFKKIDKQMVFCTAYEEKSGNMNVKSSGGSQLSLFKSGDFYRSSQVVFKNVVGFAISENFMVIAVLANDMAHLDFRVSLDGDKFADAVFPPSLDASTTGFTVLESKSGSIFLDMFKTSVTGNGWGNLFVSNWNGTFYSMSVEGTNRNSEGYVDYERMLGIEGVAVMNQVSNRQGASRGEQKQIVSLMTFNEGGSWQKIQKPELDSANQRYGCQDSSVCNLHFHGFTERKRIKNEMSDEGAAGIMIGVGNVGTQLDPFEQSSTFLTRNAGNSWKEIVKGPHLFEFGDHGSVIVLAHATDPVNHVWYSVNEGASFQKQLFSSSTKIYADRFVTDPTGTQQKFLLFGKVSDTNGGVIVQLDFSEYRAKKCVLDIGDISKSDFELWSVVDHSNNSCIFGHETQYYRRKVGSDCYIGENFSNGKLIAQTCPCSAADFECDSGFYRDPTDKVCKPVGGLNALVWSECENGQQYLSSGYRKHALSTCKDGENLAKPLQITACAWSSGGAGSGGAWAAGILIPLGILGGLACLYYKQRIAPYRYSIRLAGSDAEDLSSGARRRSSRLSSLRGAVDGVKDFVSGLTTDLKARVGYRAVPTHEQDYELHMDDYE